MNERMRVSTLSSGGGGEGEEEGEEEGGRKGGVGSAAR